MRFIIQSLPPECLGTSIRIMCNWIQTLISEKCDIIYREAVSATITEMFRDPGVGNQKSPQQVPHTDAGHWQMTICGSLLLSP